MADIYIRLNYKEYKALERAMREVKETTHMEGTDFYHKALRLPISEGVVIEFYGPGVRRPDQS
jgi:hypothetical protein